MPRGGSDQGGGYESPSPGVPQEAPRRRGSFGEDPSGQRRGSYDGRAVEESSVQRREEQNQRVRRGSYDGRSAVDQSSAYAGGVAQSASPGSSADANRRRSSLDLRSVVEESSAQRREEQNQQQVRRGSYDGRSAVDQSYGAGVAQAASPGSGADGNRRRSSFDQRSVVEESSVQRREEQNQQARRGSYDGRSAVESSAYAGGVAQAASPGSGADGNRRRSSFDQRSVVEESSVQQARRGSYDGRSAVDQSYGAGGAPQASSPGSGADANRRRGSYDGRSVEDSSVQRREENLVQRSYDILRSVEEASAVGGSAPSSPPPTDASRQRRGSFDGRSAVESSVQQRREENVSAVGGQRRGSFEGRSPSPAPEYSPSSASGVSSEANRQRSSFDQRSVVEQSSAQSREESQAQHGRRGSFDGRGVASSSSEAGGGVRGASSYEEKVSHQVVGMSSEESSHQRRGSFDGASPGGARRGSADGRAVSEAVSAVRQSREEHIVRSKVVVYEEVAMVQRRGSYDARSGLERRGSGSSLVSP
jgi:hypothetical protein